MPRNVIASVHMVTTLLPDRTVHSADILKYSKTGFFTVYSACTVFVHSLKPNPVMFACRNM